MAKNSTSFGNYCSVKISAYEELTALFVLPPLFTFLYHLMQFFHGFINAAHLIDNALGHRLAAHQNRTQILCQHTGIHHHFFQLLLTGKTMVCNKSGNPILHLLKVIIGLGRADHQAV